MNSKSFLVLAVVLIVSACTGQKNISTPLPLATVNENDVEVSIHIDTNTDGEYFLSATFTPPDGYHMYGKDIPVTGVDGLGRPTLLELTTESQLKPLGGLIESVSAEVPNFEPKELLVYPPGAVTLSLPIELPPGNDWVDDFVIVTYMACSDRGCKAPVTGKIIPIRIPGADRLTGQK